MKTIITPSQAVKLAFADGMYVGAGSITLTDIAAAEQRYIVPVVGRALYERLLEGAYADFSTAYIAPATALCTRLMLQSRLDVRTGQCGTSVLKSSDFQPAGDSSLRRLRQSLRTHSRELLRRISEHLTAHPETFPEYDPQNDITQHCTTDGGLVQIH